MNHANRVQRTPQWAALVAGILLYLGLFSVYYPPLAGIDDEAGFINQAIIWSKGAWTAEGAGIADYGSLYEVNGHHISWRNPGRSLLITPLIALFGLSSVFASGAVIHIAMVLAAALIFDTLAQSPLWALLVLWHPTLGVYSRTVMGDTPAGLFLLLALLAVVRFKRGWMWAGIFLGVATWMRYHSALAIPLFLLVMWKESPPSRKKDAVKCLLVAAACFAPLPVFNLLQYGRIYGRYGPSDQSLLGLEFFVPNAIFYAGALLLVWPGMLLALFAKRREAFYAQAMCIPVIVFFCFYFFHDQGATFLQTAILGQRLLQCILPVLIVAYGLELSERWLPALQAGLGRPATAVAMIAVAAVLVAGQWYTFARHQAQLLTLKEMRDEVARKVPGGSIVLANMMVRKLFGIPGPGLPNYRWLIYDREHSANLPSSRWYLAFFPKRPGDEVADGVAEYAAANHLWKVPTSFPGLILLETPPALYGKR